MQLIYSILIELTWWVIFPFGLLNKRFRKAFTARQNQKSRFKEWRNSLNANQSVYWFHCASLGEFEQARTVLEKIKSKEPQCVIALTFFSDSGFENKKNYSGADWIGYLPFDRLYSVRSFLKILNPKKAFLVKYEIWPNLFFELKKISCTIILFSARFKKDQRFFGIFSGFWKSVLRQTNFLFVQDQASFELMQSFNLNHLEIAGDTRFDRVLEIASYSNSELEDRIKQFAQNSPLLVLGSSYSTEEKFANAWLNNNPHWKIIVVPHEVFDYRIAEIEQTFSQFTTQRWSNTAQCDQASVLIVDSIGLLSSIYKSANAVIIGGGFNKGIHNTLEAAVFDKPLFFGPKFKTFLEAIDLMKIGAAHSFTNQEEFNYCIEKFGVNNQSSGGKHYIQNQSGATSKILNSAFSRV
jgi:3-deoxy-D-manno-octulosonic-acid transferase